ncbi:MAG: hypothetical protein IJJ43_05865, partial [Oscillospiraceae bacterium]|nr:hypothetical protein [Oscillospiraceae bacterium]
RAEQHDRQHQREHSFSDRAHSKHLHSLLIVDYHTTISGKRKSQISNIRDYLFDYSKKARRTRLGVPC